jgi:hypothetical protein
LNFVTILIFVVRREVSISGALLVIALGFRNCWMLCTPLCRSPSLMYVEIFYLV